VANPLEPTKSKKRTPRARPLAETKVAKEKNDKIVIDDGGIAIINKIQLQQ
jgi:hypothetical protein